MNVGVRSKDTVLREENPQLTFTANVIKYPFANRRVRVLFGCRHVPLLAQVGHALQKHSTDLRSQKRSEKRSVTAYAQRCVFGPFSNTRGVAFASFRRPFLPKGPIVDVHRHASGLGTPRRSKRNVREAM